jgi:hypothetical protein
MSVDTKAGTLAVVRAASANYDAMMAILREAADWSSASAFLASRRTGFRNFAKSAKRRPECQASKSFSTAKLTAQFRFWSGLITCRRRCRTSVESEFNGSRKWDTSCVGQKLIFSATASTNSASDSSTSTIESSTSFYGRVAAILAHGLKKEDRVPGAAIDLALARKRRYERDPRLHRFEE